MVVESLTKEARIKYIMEEIVFSANCVEIAGKLHVNQRD